MLGLGQAGARLRLSWTSTVILYDGYKAKPVIGIAAKLMQGWTGVFAERMQE